MGKNKKYSGIFILRVVLVLTALLLWEYVARKGYINVFYTSYPSEIIKDLIEFYTSGDLERHTKITLQEALLGLFYGSIVGILLAVIFSQFKKLGKLIIPILSAINCIPQLALAPVYVLWFGLGLSSKVFLAAFMVFFCVFFSTYNAIKNIEQSLVESSSLLGANSLQTLFYVVLPACMPWILSGIRGGVGACMIGAIIGEYMGASGGFGWMVTYAASYFNVKRVMSCIFILLLVGLFLNWLLDRVENLLLKWRVESDLSITNY